MNCYTRKCWWDLPLFSALFPTQPSHVPIPSVPCIPAKAAGHICHPQNLTTGDVWPEGIPIQAPGAPSATVWSCSASKIPPLMGSFSNRRHAGIVRAQLQFLAHSREARVCLECLRAAGAGGRDEVMACRDSGPLTLSYCCFQQSHICFQHLGKFILPFNGNKRNPRAHIWTQHFNLLLVLHFSCFGWDIIYANPSTCFGKERRKNGSSGRKDKTCTEQSKTHKAFFSLGVLT